MRNRILRGAAIAVLALMIVAMPVAAVADITNAVYSGTITVTNAAGVATNVCVPFTLSTAGMITNSMLNATANDATIRNLGVDVPLMPGWGANPWVYFIPSVPTGVTYDTLYSKGVTGSTPMYFPDSGGMTTLSSNSLLPGFGATTTWAWEAAAYFDTSAAMINNIIYKINTAWNGKIYVSAAGQIIFTLNSAVNSITANVASGYHVVRVDYTSAAGGSAYFTIDGVAAAPAPLTLTSNDGTNPVAFANGTCPYVEYMKIWQDGVLHQHITWQYAATFTDQSGNGNTATPTFRTTSTDGDVSAALTSFAPINLSQSSGYTLGGGTTFIGAVPGSIPNIYDEGETGGLIIDDFVNPALATADIPKEVFWFPIAFAIAIGLGFLAFAFTRQLIVQAVVSGIVMAAFCGGGTLGDGLIPWFTVIIFAIEAFLIIVIHERQQA